MACRPTSTEAATPVAGNTQSRWRRCTPLQQVNTSPASARNKRQRRRHAQLKGVFQPGVVRAVVMHGALVLVIKQEAVGKSAVAKTQRRVIADRAVDVGVDGQRVPRW